ncbi:hypothetical protein QBC38DRAFT_462448 [Podospora fimiseda]|uniref:Polymerase nucleotidyl transferase domain-containing protein n=1 Tax=Podospora fimiseda TaxID=252190 RepID=A0AAN7BCD0_9PEZI|nr:hypothetical protein QBC38DRAFT_462448 [Podospora fimiseda]
MYDHHASSITKITSHFHQDPDVLALLLTGSIAHGFQTPESDVDVLVVLTEEAYQARLDSGDTTFVRHDLCTYEGGYVDGKYTSLSFIRTVAEKGSEPSRWAFDGAKVLFSRNIPDDFNLEKEIKELSRYPVEEKSEKIKRFRTQLEIWKWYCSEGRKKNNKYLLTMAVGKLVLFGGRLILAHNELLYPYHKWFPRVLSEAKEKPVGLMEKMEAALNDPSEENTQGFYEMIVGFKEWERPKFRFGAQFMEDSELNWLYLQTPIDDI